MDNLKPGKRYYWFSWSCKSVLSGLYGGERGKSGLVLIHRKNGDIWEIPEEILYNSEKEAMCKKKRRPPCK